MFNMGAYILFFLHNRMDNQTFELESNMDIMFRNICLLRWGT